MTITLRPYQQDAVDAAWVRFATDQSTLFAMATGCGKTAAACGMGARLVEEYGRPIRTLLLCDQRHLTKQAVKHVAKHWQHVLGTPGVVMGKLDEYKRDFVACTVQSLVSNGRMARLLSKPVDFVILDECHHAVAPTWQQCIEEIKDANPDVKILGLTATPRRTDDVGLEKVFDSVACRLSIAKAIEIGALCPFEALGFRLEQADLDALRQNEDGEFIDQEEVDRILEAANAEEIVIEKWEEYAAGRPTLVFTSTVAQAYRLAAKFHAAGHKFYAIEGNTPQEERDRLVKAYRAGDIDGIVNVRVFAEGFDAPWTECIAFLAPTGSDLVYVQKVGRGLRLYPGKVKALILDFVPAGERDFRMAGDLLEGKPKAQRKAESKAADVGVLFGLGINSKGEGIDADPDQVRMMVLDYLTNGARDLPWTLYKDDGLATCAISFSRTLAVILKGDGDTPPEVAARLDKADGVRANGEWQPNYDPVYKALLRQDHGSFKVLEVRAIKEEGRRTRYVVTPLGRSEDWETARDIAERHADKWEDKRVARRRKQWRGKPMSDKQIPLLKKLHIYSPDLDRGQASQLIDHTFTRQRLQRYGYL
jgi:superfamily II DNA or RNA helicase